MEKIILLGGGGHCKVVIEAIILQHKFKIVGILDRKGNIGKKVLAIPIIGLDDDLSRFYLKGIKNCFISVGSVGNYELRAKLFKIAKKNNMRFPNVIHPLSLISKSVRLGVGNYIGPGAIINAQTSIGNNCIINTSAVIEHDCKIGDFAHIAPGALLAGGVRVGKGAHIGLGSCVLQNLTIGEDSIIGAGSVVVKNIDSNVVAFGRYCHRIKNNE